MKNKKLFFWEAVATLIGTIVGAGILGLPYAVAQVGFVWGGFLIIILGFVAMTLNLLFAEIILRTRSRHQLSGYVGQYLGKYAYLIMAIANILGSYVAMSTYIIGEGKVLQALLGGSEKFYSLLYFAVVAFILFIGLKLIKVFELFLVFAFLIVIAVVIGLSSPHLILENLPYFEPSQMILPFGVILFAFSGVSSVVHVREILRGREEKIKPAIITASVIPILLYFFFTLVVVGLLGRGTTEVATIGLGEKLGSFMILFGNLFAFFVMGTSFLAVGLSVKELFRLDFKISANWAWLLTVGVPLLIFLSGVKNFVWLMGLSGGLSVTLTGIMVVLSYFKAKKEFTREPEFVLPKLKIWGWFIITIFSLGILYTLVNLF
ncbi:MAG: aromatic amino acid transport family protein [Patescibacteria group bacterium]